MCGEKSLAALAYWFKLGSPPRMRGKGVVHVFVPEKFGITPACAGKRAPALCRPPCRKDHPRMCGEKGDETMEHIKRGGSPPHVRGKEIRSLHAFS